MNRRTLLAVAVAACMFAPVAASAIGITSIVPPDCNAQGGCSSICDLAQLAQNVLDDGIYIAVFLSAVLFAYSGGKLVMSSSAGDSGGVSAARKTIINVAIGLVILLSAWLIVSVIMSALTNSSNWNNLCNSTGTGSTSLVAPATTPVG